MIFTASKQPGTDVKINPLPPFDMSLDTVLGIGSLAITVYMSVSNSAQDYHHVKDVDEVIVIEGEKDFFDALRDVLISAVEGHGEKDCFVIADIKSVKFHFGGIGITGNVAKKITEWVL